MEITKSAVYVLNALILMIEFDTAIGRSFADVNYQESSINRSNGPKADDIHIENIIERDAPPNRQDNIFEVGIQRHEHLARSDSTAVKIIASKNGCNCSVTVCNCSRLELNKIPNDLPSTITVLDLSFNFIHDLPPCSFCSYANLQSLNLSSNRITNVSSGSFLRLGLLIDIDLSNNLLLYNLDTFPAGTFKNLTSLKILKLNKNTDPAKCNECYYPDLALSDLKNVTDLYLDGLENPQLGSGFRQMTSLTKLIFVGFREGFCNMIALKNDTFKNVSRIQDLTLRNCNLRNNSVESALGLLLPLKDLRRLDISYNRYLGMHTFEKLVGCIRHYNVTFLEANYIRLTYDYPVIIGETLVESLPRSLIHIEAAGNNFYGVHHTAMQVLPPNITYLYLRSNWFAYGFYMKNLTHLNNLETIILSGGENLAVFPESVSSLVSTLDSSSNDNKPDNNTYVFQLPPKTYRIDLSVYKMAYTLSNISIDPNNSLKYLDLSSNYFPVLRGPILGLGNLVSLNLSYNSVNNISDYFFTDFSSLKELNLSGNSLGTFYANSKRSVKPFRHLQNLTRIVLSNNGFDVVHKDMFEGLDKLEELIMDISTMWHFNITISHMSSLRLLNLSHGQIRELPDHVRSHIDTLTSDPTKGVIVDLSYNPIPCECQYVDMIQWMVKSRAFDPKFRNYMCLYPDGSYKIIDDAYEETLSYLNHACANNYPTFLFVIFGTLLMIFVVIGGIISRFRWHLRYLYYAAYLKFKVGRKDQDSRTYAYDAFVSYSHQDEMFVVHKLTPELSRRGLRVCLHGRDFIAGSYIASNILSAVKESRKTLVVLTRNLLNSRWCVYEMQMANMEAVHTGRQVLVFVIKDKLPSHELTPDLLYYVKHNTYIEYPDTPREGDRTLNIFWDKLSEDLKK